MSSEHNADDSVPHPAPSPQLEITKNAVERLLARKRGETGPYPRHDGTIVLLEHMLDNLGNFSNEVRLDELSRALLKRGIRRSPEEIEQDVPSVAEEFASQRIDDSGPRLRFTRRAEGVFEFVAEPASANAMRNDPVAPSAASSSLPSILVSDDLSQIIEHLISHYGRDVRPDAQTKNRLAILKYIRALNGELLTFDGFASSTEGKGTRLTEERSLRNVITEFQSHLSSASHRFRGLSLNIKNERGKGWKYYTAPSAASVSTEPRSMDRPIVPDRNRTEFNPTPMHLSQAKRFAGQKSDCLNHGALLACLAAVDGAVWPGYPPPMAQEYSAALEKMEQDENSYCMIMDPSDGMTYGYCSLWRALPGEGRHLLEATRQTGNVRSHHLDGDAPLAVLNPESSRSPIWFDGVITALKLHPYWRALSPDNREYFGQAAAMLLLADAKRNFFYERLYVRMSHESDILWAKNASVFERVIGFPKPDCTDDAAFEINLLDKRVYDHEAFASLRNTYLAAVHGRST